MKLEDIVDFVLEAEDGRDVVVLQLTDVQIIDATQQRYKGRLSPCSEQWWAPENMEARAFAVMRQIVNRVKPDLIVLSGDNVYGEFDDSGATLRKLIAEMESYGIPWTLTFGNHDNETRKGVAWTCEQYRNAPHCMFTRGPIDKVEGNGNFTIGITQNGKLGEVVWLMDSNGHTDNDPAQNMFSRVGVLDGQLAWFKETNERLREYNGGVSPKSIGFFHHPVRALGNGMQKYGYVSPICGFYDKDGGGRFEPFVIPQNGNGDSGCMNYESGYIDDDYVFHTLLKQYNCEGWFFGHVHENNTSVKYEGVRYTFGLKSAYYDTFANPTKREGGLAVSVIGRDEIGGTRILLGERGLRVCHEYYVTGDGAREI